LQRDWRPATLRSGAVDALRGLTILVMVFVNQLAGVRGMPAWARHMPADADAMSFVDVVFPAFLFIVGMAIPFALGRRRERGEPPAALQAHVLARTAGLLVIGFFMVNAESGYDERWMPWPIAVWELALYACVLLVWAERPARVEGRARAALRALGVLGLLVLADAYHGGADGHAWMTHQWWGILGLIGWSYLIAATVFLVVGGRPGAHLLAAAACIGFYALSHAIDPAADPGWAAVFGERALVCETSLTFLGIATSLLFFGVGGPRLESGGRALRRRFAQAAGLVVALLVAGALLRPAYTISKIYGSPTWCLWSAAICIALFCALLVLVDLRGGQRAVRWLEPAAANPLVAYLIPFVADAALRALHLNLPDALGAGWPGLVFCVAWAFAVLGATALVARRLRLRL
jgi:predicted acyltransferase